MATLTSSQHAPRLSFLWSLSVSLRETRIEARPFLPTSNSRQYQTCRPVRSAEMCECMRKDPRIGSTEVSPVFSEDALINSPTPRAAEYRHWAVFVFYYACSLLPGPKWQDATVIVVGRDSLLLPHLTGCGPIMQVSHCLLHECRAFYGIVTRLEVLEGTD